MRKSDGPSTDLDVGSDVVQIRIKAFGNPSEDLRSDFLSHRVRLL